MAQPTPSDAPSPLQLALSYAARGWPVFPCNPLTKKPITANGFYDAAVDPTTIREWWKRFPNAMIGCPTGPRSGFWILDADVDIAENKNGIAEVSAMGVLPETVEQTTPRGGRHSFFRWDDSRPVKSIAGKLASAVDTRGRGGYIILAGSVRSDGARYQWAISPENGKILDAPDWLYEKIGRAREKAAAPQVNIDAEFPFAVERVTVEAAAKFKEQCLLVAQTESGSRNDTLNKAAFAVGQFVGRGEIAAARVAEGLLWAAQQCGLADDDGDDSARKTIQSGLTSGAEVGVKTTAAYWFEPVEDLAGVSEGRTALAKSDGFAARPYQFPELSKIPKRRWLYGAHYRRKTVSATVAPSKVGKSSLGIVEALAMASGKPLLGIAPDGQFRVWIWNGEDDIGELELRVAACMKHYGLTPEDIGDRLFLNSGLDTPIVVATAAKIGATIQVPIVDAVIREIRKNRIDVMLVDPFVTVHRVSENDNTAIDAVAKTWVRIAVATESAIEIVHHTRKMNGEESTADDARGASAMVAASRSIRALSRMNDTDAKTLGLTPIAASLFRVTGMSGNMAPAAPDVRQRWYRLIGVAAGNGEGDELDAAMTGDQVGVVTLFNSGEETKSMLKKAGAVGVEIEAAIRQHIAAQTWRTNSRAADWIGHAFAEALGLPIEGKDAIAEANRETVKNAVRDWFNRKLLREVSYQDNDYKTRVFVELTEIEPELEPVCDLFD